MTLIVSAFWIDPGTGVAEHFTDWDDGRYMAGVERGREDLWGSEPVRRRGARFLPQLVGSDLWVAPGDLEAFVKEVEMLSADVEGLRAELGRGPDCSLPYYLANFLRAAKFAAAKGGGVTIS